MKFKNLILITLVLAMGFTAAAQKLERQWDYSGATDNKPAWFTGFTNRGIAANPEYVFVTSRSEALNEEMKSVLYYKASSGEMLGNLDVSIVSTSQFSVNDVEVSDDGQILVSNLAFYHEKWTPDGTWQFRIYKWANVDAEPEVFIDYDNPQELRIGDLISVHGSLDSNAIIYAAIHGAAKTMRWEVVDGELNDTPEIIDLIGITETGGALNYPKIISTGDTKEDPFYYNASGVALKKFSADGSTILEEITPSNFLPSNGDSDYRDNSITSFTAGDRNYIAAMGVQGASAAKPAEVKAIDVTDGLNEAIDPFYSASLGPGDNTQLNGDIASTTIDGETWVFLLYSQSGFAAYKYVAPLPEVEVPVTEAGWRRGSNPNLDSIDNRLSRPDWLTDKSRAVAVGDDFIYVVNCAEIKEGEDVSPLGEILVLDASNGSYLNKKLNVDSVNSANAYSSIRISDVEVDDAGHILASNMRMGNAFNIFVWDDADSEPYLLVSADGIPYENENDEQSIWQQTAYSFDVKGDIKGDAVIAIARSNLSVTYRWVISDGEVQNEGQPIVTKNNLGEEAGHFGPYASVALESAEPDSPVWVNGLSINPIRMDSEGNLLGAIPDSVATNISQDVSATLVTKYFEWEETKYLLEYNWVWADHARLIDVSAEDLSTLTSEDWKEVGRYLGQEPNPLKWGDVDYIIADDGSLNIVTLVTNNGIRLDRYEATSTSTAIKMADSELKIYPNPAQEILHIDHPSGVKEVNVFGITGSHMKRVVGPDVTSVRINDLKAGFYIVLVTTRDGITQSSKIIKQ